MERKIDAVKLMRQIRLKLGKKYLNYPERELQQLKDKFGYFRKKKVRMHSK